MGVLADFLANSTTIDAAAPRDALDRGVVRKLTDYINSLGDPAYPSGMAAVDEVQEIAIHEDGVDGGTFTLTITLFGGVSFTTAAIAFDANAATIEAAIDLVAAPKVPGFTAGDIAVTGGPLTTDPLVLTFDGATVAAKNHGLTVITSSLTDGGVAEDAGEVTVTDAGQPLRTAYSTLIVIGILSAPAPAHGATDDIVVQNARGSFPNNIDEATVRAIVNQLVVEEGNEAIGTAVLTALGY